MKDWKTLMSELRAEQKRQNMTNVVLGEKIGICSKQVPRLFSGKHCPNMGKVLAICEALNVGFHFDLPK